LSDNKGFYLGHSMPNFPNITSDLRINMTVPDTANIYGQSFICMSLNSSTLETVASTLNITKPNVYFT